MILSTMFLLINSCAAPGLDAGIDSLSHDLPLLDVLEAVLRASEADRTVRTVGIGGRPNAIGQVELDASLMEGHGRRTGSVAALQGFLHPVSIARQIMERLPHEILVGEGASRFAREIGAEEADLLTPESAAEWREWLAENPDPPSLSRLVWRSAIPGVHRDTAIALASDGKDLASGTSTSGWAFKYPGRLGDSALVGSGHYADSRVGAAACTHTGEMTIRAGTARAIVHAMERGMIPEEACRAAIADLRRLEGGFLSDVVVYAVDPAGRHFAATTGATGSYRWWTDAMSAPESRKAIVIA